MPRDSFDVPLAGLGPGMGGSVRFLRYGSAEAAPKAYLHAALHADEAPGLLVLHHLRDLLDAAEARGEILGQIVIAPYANPLGLSQVIHGDHLGRFDLASGQNFNRGWPDLAPDLIARLGARLGSCAEANRALIRATIRDILAARRAASPLQSLFGVLAAEAFDADLVLDLHCDDEGLMHLFLHPEIWPQMQDLAAGLGCHAVFAQRGAAGGPFAAACMEPWLQLAAAFPDHPVPVGCQSATVELRGFADVSDGLARADALALMDALRRRGYLAGPVPPAPDPLCAMTDFAACDMLRAPGFGVIVYHAALGERVSKGQMVAEIVDPSGSGAAARTPVLACTDGLVLTRRLKKLLAAGQVIAKIAGETPLPHRSGYLLED